jgi:hypothetical protein
MERLALLITESAPVPVVQVPPPTVVRAARASVELVALRTEIQELRQVVLAADHGLRRAVEIEPAVRVQPVRLW